MRTLSEKINVAFRALRIDLTVAPGYKETTDTHTEKPRSGESCTQVAMYQQQSWNSVFYCIILYIIIYRRMRKSKGTDPNRSVYRETVSGCVIQEEETAGRTFYAY